MSLRQGDVSLVVWVGESPELVVDGCVFNIAVSIHALNIFLDEVIVKGI